MNDIGDQSSSRNGSSAFFSRLKRNASEYSQKFTDLFTRRPSRDFQYDDDYRYDDDNHEIAMEEDDALLLSASHGEPSNAGFYGSMGREETSLTNELQVIIEREKEESLLQGRSSYQEYDDFDEDDDRQHAHELGHRDHFEDGHDQDDDCPPKGFNRKRRRSSKLQVPIINISQDFNLLTVDTGSYGHGSLHSSGFNTPIGPGSPTPTFASSFEFQHQPSKKFSWKRSIKIFILVGIFLAAAVMITAQSEKEDRFSQVTTQQDKPFQFPVILPQPIIRVYPILSVTVKGNFLPESYENASDYQLIISVERQDEHNKIIKTVSKKWRLGIVVGDSSGSVKESTRTTTFNLAKIDWSYGPYALVFRTNSEEVVPVAVSIRLIAEGIENGAIYGGAVLVGLYILIIFELVNRTLSAMLAAAAAIAILSFLNERPTTMEMVSWLDMETLILLFSMMIMVSIFCETGFFDYSAFVMYKITNGQVWPLITGLCMFTAFVSAFLDNVTTVLLMTPVTIRICEAMTLNPVPVLISIVIFSNIGGAVTPVGDPPNVIISNNPEVLKAGIDFAIFSLHMMLGIIPVLLVSYIQLRITFRNMKSLQFSEPYEVAELRREIEVWLRAADSLSSYSKDESHVRTLLLSKIRHLKGKLKTRIRMGGQTEESYKANLLELELSCKIRDWTLLIKCGVVLTVVIIMFFLHSVPQLNLSLGWTALLGAIFLLILADRRELEGIFTRVEWSTLIFFSALFIVMEAVSKLGLLRWIGKQTEFVIGEVNEESRLTVAILIILWISGLASAFIDNIPFTTMMIQIVTGVAKSLHLPLQPLIWALAFGTCLGGNGTLIGASANVVCAGVADQHGYRFTFMEYFRIGFPMMIVSLIVSTAYLLICHTALSWNY